MPNLNTVLRLLRMSRERLILLIILLVLVLIINKDSVTTFINTNFPDTKLFGVTRKTDGQVQNVERQHATSTAFVTHIADGDTVDIRLPNGDKEIVRLLAVNTLEMTSTNTREVCFAKLAKDFTTTELLNKQVAYTSDPTQPKRDKYGRLLLYLQVAGESQTFNEKLMHTGLAKTYKASPPAQEWQKYETIRAEKERRQEGIWNPNLCIGFTP